MDRAASFVVRWRITLISLTLAVALSVTWIADAKADGRGSGTPSVAALGDWTVSGGDGIAHAREPASPVNDEPMMTLG